MECMRFLSNRTEDCVYRNKGINQWEHADVFWTHSYRLIPGRQQERPYEIR
jgi:hypothetical protein